MKVAAVVIIYYPEKEIFNNILSYCDFFSKTFVVDNSERPHPSFVKKIQTIPTLQYISDGVNKGIAARLNEICHQVIKEGFDFLLTMDQDSFFEAEDLRQYLSCIHNHDCTSIAMFGVNYIQRTSVPDKCMSQKTTQLITSGSMINLDLFNIIGGFDEALFIDEVDTDYCYAAITKGYDIITFENIFLHHNLGIVSQFRS